MSDQVLVPENLVIGDAVLYAEEGKYLGDPSTPGVIAAINEKGLATVKFPRVLCNEHTVSDWIFHDWMKPADEYLFLEGLSLDKLTRLEGGIPEPTLQQLVDQLWPRYGQIACYTLNAPEAPLDKSKPCHVLGCADGLQEKITLTNCWGNVRAMYCCDKHHKEFNGLLADDHPQFKPNLS